jgi:hypothetical protein
LWGELGEGAYNGTVRKEVAVEVSGFDVEDIDEDADVGEYMLALLGEVVFHESILSCEELVCRSEKMGISGEQKLGSAFAS